MILKTLCPHCYNNDFNMHPTGWIQGWVVCKKCGHEFIIHHN